MHWFRDLHDYLSRTYVTPSGKPTKRRGKIEAFGEKCHLIMPLNADGTVDYTLEEIAAMTIQCAWCGKPIFIGDPITLYTPLKEGETWHPFVQPAPAFIIPDYAVVYCANPLQLVGCGRVHCSDTFADYSGLWIHDPKTGKGMVERHPNAIEQMMMSPEAEGGIIDADPDGLPQLRTHS